jgi:hypothetical protein
MEHINYLMTTMFSSIFKDSNLPELMSGDRLVHHVYCHQVDLDYLEKNYTPLAATKELEVIYHPTMINRHNLFSAVVDQFRRCVANNCVALMSSADFVWSGGLADSLKTLKKGQAIFCPTFRIKASGYGAVMDFLKTEHTNEEFSKLFIETIPHKLLELAKEKRWDYQHLQKCSDGWNFFHKEPVPLAYFPTQDIIDLIDVPGQSLEMLDHYVPQLLFDRGRARWVTGNNDVFVGEFTVDDKYGSMIENGFMNPAAGFFMNLPLHHKTV